MTRATHWVKPNHQVRIPRRWISFDTEARRDKDGKEEIQSWGTGAGVFWTREKGTNSFDITGIFNSPEDLWEAVTGFCLPEHRTVVFAHNISYDIRVSRALDCLPKLGWALEWSNLDRSVSSMTWRSSRGTLVLADSFTWLPMGLDKVAQLINMRKMKMPLRGAGREDWDRYCLNDAVIVGQAVKELVDWIDENELGNWQPTGAGMSYSTWRHKYMSHKVLVHDNTSVLHDERRAMHTGRAEAWRHGELRGERWYEVDLRQAYTRIAAESELPAKYKFTAHGISQKQYEELSQTYAVLAVGTVHTDLPVVPHHNGQRTIWPVGKFRTSLWDVEVNQVLASGGAMDIEYVHVYTREPLLADWAKWVIGLVEEGEENGDTVVSKYAKHMGRSLIGRLSLRVPEWEYFGTNPYGETCISYNINATTGNVQRYMHIGEKTFAETERREGKDSLPQITGWIMAECRVRLLWAMDAAGMDNIAHVDTDSVLVNEEGLARLKEYYGGSFGQIWTIKGRYGHVTVYGPRNLRVGSQRKTSGIPLGAKEVQPNVFHGEQWRGLASDLEIGRSGVVTVVDMEWKVNTKDPRRMDASGGHGMTQAIRLPLG